MGIWLLIMTATRLYFCPDCRSVSINEDLCSSCGLLRSDQSDRYIERLLETIFSTDPTRVGMAIDILTKWLHEPRTIVPLLHLAQSNVDIHRIVMAVRGLGWLGDPEAIPTLSALLSDQEKSFFVRINAAHSLGQIGDEFAEPILRQATTDKRSGVAQAATKALEDIAMSKRNLADSRNTS